MFNGPFSGTTQVSRYQKGKTNLDFTEARAREWQWHQLGRMQVCILLQTDNHTSTPPLSFLQAGCPSCRPTNSVKALKAQAGTRKVNRSGFFFWSKRQSSSGISWAICKSASRSRLITMPSPNHSVFYRPNALPATQPTASKHWRYDFLTYVIRPHHDA